jgi:predicted CoA-binding protein
MNPMIEDFIQCKKIAVAGVSRSGKKFGNMACKELKGKGYEVFPIHPQAKEIDGLTCHPNLKSVEGKVEGLLISVHPQKVIPVLEEASEIGLKHIWLQQGAWSKEVQSAIDRLQLPVVTKKCIMMYAPPVTSVHKFHRVINRFFGKL